MKRIHYGWFLCLVGALLMMCNSGMPSNVLPVYLPFLEEMGYTGAQTSLLITIRCFAGVVTMTAVTKYYEKLDLKLGLMICCALVSGGYLLMSFASSYILYAVGAAMMGTSYGIGALVPVSMLMNRWFARSKATAIALCASGSGLCALVMPPLVTGVAQNTSLSTSFRTTALIAAGILLLVLLTVRNRPEDMGLRPYGADADGEEKKKDRVYSQRYNLSGWVKWLFLAGIVMFGGASMSSYSHNMVLFTTSGHAKEIAALCCSLQGGVLIGSKFVYGIIVDRIGGRRASLLFLSMLVLGTAFCGLCSVSPVFMYLGSILCGLGFPPASVGISVWAVEFSSDDTYAGVLRNYQLCYLLGGLLMSSLPGHIYDAFGSYSGAFLLLAGLMALFTLLLWAMYRYARHQLARMA